MGKRIDNVDETLFSVLLGDTPLPDIILSLDAGFDLVLLDMKLPDIDAKEIFFAIKKAHPETKVIIFSGYAIDGPVQEILDAGADGFIQKPFSFPTLSSKLRAVLGNSKEAMNIS